MEFLMIKLRFILVMIITLSSCALFKPTIQDRMSKRLIGHKYDQSLKEALPKVQTALEKRNSFGAKAIILSTPPGHIKVAKAQAKIKEEMEKGFTYDRKFFKAKDFSIEFTDLFKDNIYKNLKSKLDDTIKTGNIHLVKNTKKEFIYVKGSSVISAKVDKDGKTVVNACSLHNYKRGPLNIDLDTSALLANGLKQSFETSLLMALKLSKGPILLEESMKYCKRDRAMELVVFYELDPVLAKKWEDKFSRL